MNCGPYRIDEKTLGRVYQHVAGKKATSWGMLTAYRWSNTKKENEEANKRLEADLRKMGYGFFKLEGQWQECQDKNVSYEDCPKDQLQNSTEESLFIPNIKSEEIAELGKKYEQDGVVYGDKDNDAHLIYKNGKSTNIGKFQPGKVAQAYSKLKGDRTFVFQQDDTKAKGVKLKDLIPKSKSANNEKPSTENLAQRLEKKLIILQDSWDEKNGGQIKGLKEKRDKITKHYQDAVVRGKLSDDNLLKLKEKTTEFYGKIQSKIDSLRKEAGEDRDKKDPEYRRDVNDLAKYRKMNDKFIENGSDINKFSPDDQKEFRRLVLKASPIFLTKRPGDVLQITTTSMGEADGSILAQEYQKAIKEFTKKEFNGKPKGVILDNRLNIGGSQDAAKGILDFFVKGDEYPIETQKFNYGVRRFDSLEQYKKTEWDDAVMKKLNKMSPEEQNAYWKESKAKGYFEVENKYKSNLKPEDKFTDVPVVLQTSIRTFSAGEFLSDSVKNLNPNVVHIGDNSGGGANQTFSGLLEKQRADSPKLSNVQNAKNAAEAFKYAYQDENMGRLVYEKISDKIKKGEINDDMSKEDMAKIVKKEAIKITNDPHIDTSVYENDNGEKEFDVYVPQIRSDRVIVDPKTRKPILDKTGKPQYNGNWEGIGVAAANTSPFFEVNANEATKHALSFIYEKTNQKKLADELDKTPEKFGISNSGLDGLFDNSVDVHQSSFINGEDGYSNTQIKMNAKNKENANKNKVEKKSTKDVVTDFEKNVSKKSGKDLSKLSNLIPKSVFGKTLQNKDKINKKDLISKLPKDILNTTVTNPETEKDIKVKSALSYDKSSPAFQAALSLIKNKQKV
jgi:hypothetical protein